MKPNYILLFVLIFFIQCNSNENDVSPTNTGKAVFYTNAQALINCGPGHIVNVYVENDALGAILNPSTEGISLPECANSEKTVVYVNKPGIYNYTAELDCGEIDWSGEFEIFRDSCTKVFLSLENSTDFKEIGRAVFYTNAQAELNSDPWCFVEISVDNDSLGVIKEAYTKDTQPDCRNSNATVFLKTKAGIHNFSAKFDCGPYEWNRQFEIFPDSCIKIFLDINEKTNQ